MFSQQWGVCSDDPGNIKDAQHACRGAVTVISDRDTAGNQATKNTRGAGFLDLDVQLATTWWGAGQGCVCAILVLAFCSFFKFGAVGYGFWFNIVRLSEFGRDFQYHLPVRWNVSWRMGAVKVLAVNCGTIPGWQRVEGDIVRLDFKAVCDVQWAIVVSVPKIMDDDGIVQPASSNALRAADAGCSAVKFADFKFRCFFIIVIRAFIAAFDADFVTGFVIGQVTKWRNTHISIIQFGAIFDLVANPGRARNERQV